MEWGIGDRFRIDHADEFKEVWIVTDTGTRVIVAMKETPGWNSGPPYAVEEVVFDEDDQKVLIKV